jgi:hypothetical protein
MGFAGNPSPACKPCRIKRRKVLILPQATLPIIVAKEAGALSDHIADHLLVSATKRNPCALVVCAWQSLVLVIVTLDFSQSETRRLE